MSSPAYYEVLCSIDVSIWEIRSYFEQSASFLKGMDMDNNALITFPTSRVLNEYEMLRGRMHHRRQLLKGENAPVRKEISEKDMVQEKEIHARFNRKNMLTYSYRRLQAVENTLPRQASSLDSTQRHLLKVTIKFFFLVLCILPFMIRYSC